MRPGKLLLFVSVLLLCAPRVLGQGSESKTGIKPGVVVEHTAKGLDGTRARLQIGDVLVTWRRANLGGRINSPFDMLQILLEQSSYGIVTVQGTRRGKGHLWRLSAGGWPETRPNFSSRLLPYYLEAEKLADNGHLSDAIAKWNELCLSAGGQHGSWLGAWLAYQAAITALAARRWTDSDQLFDLAQRLASASSWVARTMVSIEWGDSYTQRAEWVKAEELYQRAAANSSQEAGGVTCLFKLGVLALQRNDPPEAQDLLAKALTIQTKRVPTPNTLTAVILVQLGQAFEQEGSLSESEKYLRRAVSILERLAPKSYNLASTLVSLGVVDVERNELNKGLARLRESISIYRKVSPRGIAMAITLNDVGWAGLRAGDWSMARLYLERGLALAKHADASGIETARDLDNLGVLYRRTGELVQSEKYLRRGAGMARALRSQSLLLATILNDLADTLRERNDLDGAESLYREALAARERLLAGTLRHAETAGGLAEVEARKQRWGEAAALYEQAVSALENQTGKLGGSEEVRSDFRAKYENYYKNYIELLIRQGQFERAFEILERSRARTLLETLAAAHVDVHKGADPALIEPERSLQQKLTAKSNYRIQLLGGTHTDEQTKAIDSEIADLLSQLQEFESQIRASSPTYAALTQPQPLTAKQVQDQVLDEDTVLLEYSLGEECSHLFVLTPAGLNTYELPKRAEIEKQAQLVYGLLASRNQIIRAETPAQRQVRRRLAKSQYAHAAAELSRMLLSPVAKEIAGKRLLVVADGALAYIPFSLLPSPESEEPLVVGHEIVNLPSASVLAALRQQQAGRLPAPKTVAVLADPVFAKDDARVRAGRERSPRLISKSSSRPPGVGNFLDDPSPISADLLVRSAGDVGLKRRGVLRLGRLPFSRQETDAIAAVTPEDETLRALDFRASRATAMSGDLAQYRIVHFATHGLLNSRHPELSGLVLSLVDERGQPQNGFLDLQDIYNMSLAADLVVLSACQTGLGKEVDGEGLVGLTRGFMYAGASRVVASLWNVSDEATARLMAAFYKAMEQEGMQPAAALRAAQLEMLRQKRWSDPYFWAAFQIQGEWK